jgi:hypothetical protein
MVAVDDHPAAGQDCRWWPEGLLLLLHDDQLCGLPVKHWLDQ